MTAKLRASLWVLLFVALPFFVPGLAGRQHSRLIVPAGESVIVEQPGHLGRWTKRSRLVHVDAQALSAMNSKGGSLRLDLFQDASYVAVLDSIEIDPLDGYRWRGRLRGVAGSVVTLIVDGSRIAGLVTFPGSAYSIRHVRARLHAIRELDLGAFPPEAKPMPIALTADPSRDRLLVDIGDARAGEAVLDLLVLYTPAAKRAAGGKKHIGMDIRLAIERVNTALARSKAKTSFRLVGTKRIAYRESDSLGTDLARLRTKNDGYMDKAHSLRSTTGADFVHLISSGPGFCGVAYLPEGVSLANREAAFGLTQWGCLTQDTMAHELGHNMGLNHQRESNPGIRGAFPYSYGFVHQRGRRWWGTIVASAFVPRILNYSNPKVEFRGRPTGIDKREEDSANNALSIKRARTVMAQYETCKVEC